MDLIKAERTGVIAMARSIAGGAETMDEMVHQVIKNAAPLIAAQAWDEAVASMRYEDGSPVGVVRVVNPYQKGN